MTMNKLYGKLRKANIGNYKLVVGCIFFSILLISTFAVMMQSNTVQTILPEGGDSRKQMYLIFGIAVFGCLVFSVYASSLFLKSKSKEMGVMMAMGAKKRALASLLLKEITAISVAASAAGAILALPLAAVIWQIFKMTVANTEEMAFSANFSAYIWSGAFALICTAILFFLAIKFLRKTNIIDIVNAQRKNEMVKDVKPWYGAVGIILMLLGGFLGYMKASIFVTVFKMLPPAWSNVIFLLLPLGLYMFLIYIVVHGKKGRKKYKNIVSRSIMKFQGRQTVRNMCVVTLLLMGGLFAVFYIPMTLTSLGADLDSRDYSFTFKYRATEDMPSKAEIESLAGEHKLRFTRYMENRAIVLSSDGIEKDYDEGGKYIETYKERMAEANLIKESDFNKFSEEKVDVEKNKFIYIRGINESISPFDYIENITMFTNPTTGKVFKTSSQKEIKYAHAAGYFIVDDSDYKLYADGLSSQWQETMVWFDVSDYDDSFQFASALRETIIENSSVDVEIPFNYDRIEKAEIVGAGGEYWGDTVPEAKISYEEKDSAKFKTEWKYMPAFKILEESESTINYAVYMLLFVFIAILSLSAVVIILYTRSITIAETNKQVFEDMKRLGSSRKYLKKSVNGMISKLYTIPAAIGSGLIYAFCAMVFLMNSGDMSLEGPETTALMIDLIAIIVMGILLYIAYRRTMKSVYKILR